MSFIQDRGGKRGIALSMCVPLCVFFTPLRRFAEPLPSGWRPRRTVFVCAGNICRSPFAEHVALAQGLHCVSMGLRAETGKPADTMATAMAREFGIDLSSHRTTAFDVGLVHDADLVLGFEIWHVRHLQQALEGRNVQVRLAGAFAGYSHLHLHDPFGLGERYFRYCYARIGVAVQAVVDKCAQRAELLL